MEMAKSNLYCMRKGDEMIKHVVMWKLKSTVSEDEKLEIKRKLEALKGVVPSLKEIEVGIDFSDKAASMDLVLVSVFDSVEDLEAYAKHPAHCSVVDYVVPRVEKRAVVDFVV